MVPCCSCCLYLCFGSAVVLVTCFVNFGWRVAAYLGRGCSFCLPRVPFVGCRRFVYLVVSLFGFGGGMWDLIVSVPDHCFSFYFSSITAPPHSSFIFPKTLLFVLSKISWSFS